LPGRFAGRVRWPALACGQESDEGSGDPALVAADGPAPLDGEDPVHAWGQQGVDDVGGFGAVEVWVELACGVQGGDAAVTSRGR
jgi:hypothetical protein